MDTEKKKQSGFRLFLISGILLVTAFVAATILSANPENVKYAPLTVLLNIGCLILSVLGITYGIKIKFEARSDRRKRIIGIIGNSAIILFELSLIIAGTILALKKHN